MVEWLTPDFGLGHDLRVLGSSPELGSTLRGGLLKILSLCLSPHLGSKINKPTLKNKPKNPFMAFKMASKHKRNV